MTGLSTVMLFLVYGYTNETKNDVLTSSLILSVLYKLVPEARRAARKLLLATLEGIDDRSLMVDRHVVLLGMILEGQGYCHPRLLVQNGELVPSVVTEQRYHRFRGLEV